MRVKFFGPHPGFAGATIPLPPAIKSAVDALDGQELSLDEALAQLKTAITIAGVRAELEVRDNKRLIKLGDGAIALWMPKKIEPGVNPSEPTHLFRLIGFYLVP